jgi:hypothetical protein
MNVIYNVNKVDNTKTLKGDKYINKISDSNTHSCPYKHERIFSEIHNLDYIKYHLNCLVSKINNNEKVFDLPKKPLKISLNTFFNDTPSYISTTINEIHKLIKEIDKTIF